MSVIQWGVILRSGGILCWSVRLNFILVEKICWFLSLDTTWKQVIFLTCAKTPDNSLVQPNAKSYNARSGIRDPKCTCVSKSKLHLHKQYTWLFPKILFGCPTSSLGCRLAAWMPAAQPAGRAVERRVQKVRGRGAWFFLLLITSHFFSFSSSFFSFLLLWI